MTMLFMLTDFIYTHLVCKRVPESESRTGFRCLLRANGVSALTILVSNTITTAVYVLPAYLVVYLVDSYGHVNPLVRNGLDLFWYTTMVTTSASTLTALAQLLVTYPRTWIAVLHFFITIASKYFVIGLAVLRCLRMPTIAMVAINKAIMLLSSESIASLWTENLFNRVYDIGYPLPEYANRTNLLDFYRYFWICHPAWYLAHMVLCHVIFAFIIANEGECF